MEKQIVKEQHTPVFNYTNEIFEIKAEDFVRKSVNNNLGEYQKSSHSIMLGLNTSIYTSDIPGFDREERGFNLIYSYTVHIQFFFIQTCG